MTLTKTILALIISTITFSATSVAQTKVSMSDFEILHDTNWEGQLMYVNYRDGKEVVLKTTLRITIKGDKIMMSTQYNNEPEANTKSTIKLKKKGTYLGNEKIIEKTTLEDGTIKLVTVYQGKDDNRDATISKTYLFDGNHFSVTKEVTFEDTKEKLIRNKYTYTKL
ncbi:hypothetical protein [Olleya sp. YS]|uniref:hypothetical protein n=1 Tax=Olleya sp. YS TaxID=3028318 RepID=UPI0024344794|nr:hypothetical protein [Olleya sp. YS]WGD34225.1 hypothetical protein Ollyesu_10600 [Olleya sp. YS]